MVKIIKPKAMKTGEEKSIDEEMEGCFGCAIFLACIAMVAIILILII